MNRLIGCIVILGIAAGASASTAPDLKGYLQKQQVLEGYPPPSQYPQVVEPPRVDKAPISDKTGEMLRYLGDFSEVAYLLERNRFDEARAVLENLPDRSKWPVPMVLAEARLETELASRELFDARRAKARKENDKATALEKAAQERLTRAADLARGVLAKDKKNVDAWLSLAQALQQKGEQNELLDVYREARTAVPGNIDVLEKLGARLRIRLNLSRDAKERTDIVEELQSVYEELVKALPGRRSSRYQEVLAILKASAGDRKGAIEHYSSLIQLEPDEARHYTQLSRQQKEEGDEKGALETLRKGITRNPDSAELMGALGWLLRGENAKERELAFFRGIAEQYPGRDDIQQRYARALIDQERPRDAVRVLSDSLAHHPDSEKTRKMLIQTCLTQALAFTKAGKPDEALGQIEKAIDAAEDEDLPLLYDLVLPLYHQTNHLDKALVLMEKVTKEKPDDWKRRLQVAGRLYALWGKDARFAPYFDGIQKDQVDNAEATYQMALVRWEVLDEPDAAEGMFRRVLELDPKYAEAYNSLGYLYAEQNRNLDEAAKLVQKAIDLKPHQGHILDSMGWIYYQKGDYERAVEWLEKAVKQSPDETEIGEHLGRAYLKAGREREALAALKAALKKRMERPGADASESFAALRKLVDTLEHKQAAAEPTPTKKP